MGIWISSCNICFVTLLNKNRYAFRRAGRPPLRFFENWKQLTITWLELTSNLLIPQVFAC